jgi:hypothetical protein
MPCSSKNINFSGPKTTLISSKEGRLKDDILKSKRNILKRRLKRKKT